MTNIDNSFEFWMPVKGFEDRYEVSNLARVRSLGFIRKRTMYKSDGFVKGRILKQNTARPYHAVSLYDESGKIHTPYVYDLVFFSFNRDVDKIMGYEIDHKNGDKWDSTLQNLQYITKRQNISKGFLQHKVNKTSKYTGVYWHKSRSKWAARIVFNGMSVFLGRFKNEKDAANAYQKALKQVEAGTFMPLNRLVKTSKYKGVRAAANCDRWSVICKGKYIGLYKTEIEAAAAYQTALQNIENKAA